MQYRNASLDADADCLLQIFCFLNPRFKLSYVLYIHSKILEDKEKKGAIPVNKSPLN